MSFGEQADGRKWLQLKISRAKTFSPLNLSLLNGWRDNTGQAQPESHRMWRCSFFGSSLMSPWACRQPEWWRARRIETQPHYSSFWEIKGRLRGARGEKKTTTDESKRGAGRKTEEQAHKGNNCKFGALLSLLPLWSLSPTGWRTFVRDPAAAAAD